VCVGGEGSLTPALLFNYFFNESFQQVYPEVALEYLMCLYTNTGGASPLSSSGGNNSWSLAVKGFINKDTIEMHEIKMRATFLSTLESFVSALGPKQLQRMCGDIKGEGKNFHGALDDYVELGREEIYLILSRVAFNSLTVRNDSKRAIHFYKLCGRFTEALEEICRQFSLVICPFADTSSSSSQVSSSEREYWTNTALHFYKTHINVGVSECLNALRMDGREDLCVCLRKLLDCYRFVSLFQAQNYEEALVCVDGVGLLPRSIDDVGVCLTPFIAARNSSGGFGSSNNNSMGILAAGISGNLNAGTSYYKHLLNLIDGIVIYTLQCCHELISSLNEQLALNRAQFALQSTKLGQIMALKERSKALCAFVVKSPEQIFKLETRSIVAKMEFAD
jgi:hypothetical protein